MAGDDNGGAVPAAPATVAVAFAGVPDGEVYPRAFAPGDAVEGDLADVAVREGWATRGPAKAAKRG